MSGIGESDADRGRYFDPGPPLPHPRAETRSWRGWGAAVRESAYGPHDKWVRLSNVRAHKATARLLRELLDGQAIDPDDEVRPEDMILAVGFQPSPGDPGIRYPSRRDGAR